MNSNALRPAGWTSGDAAGLPMFPALVRYDECQRGAVEHACRIVVARTRRAYIYPANHYASTIPATETNVPAMGQRLRLKSSFVIPPSWSKEEKAVLVALKKYGALVADNGGFFSISVTPDQRWTANAFSHLSTVGVTNFEVVEATGPAEGPRSAGAPQADAGPDFSAPTNRSVALQGYVSFQGVPPAIRWALYSGPGAVTFSHGDQTNSMVTFSAEGTYVLMLSVDDSVHTPAYDAVQVSVVTTLRASLEVDGEGLSLSWTGGVPPFSAERAPSPQGPWEQFYSGVAHRVLVPTTTSNMFYRVCSR
jgi:hypothetical protein